MITLPHCKERPFWASLVTYLINFCPELCVRVCHLISIRPYTRCCLHVIAISHFICLKTITRLCCYQIISLLFAQLSPSCTQYKIGNEKRGLQLLLLATNKTIPHHIMIHTHHASAWQRGILKNVDRSRFQVFKLLCVRSDDDVAIRQQTCHLHVILISFMSKGVPMQGECRIMQHKHAWIMMERERDSWESASKSSIMSAA